jgi:hypothetical protein
MGAIMAYRHHLKTILIVAAGLVLVIPSAFLTIESAAMNRMIRAEISDLKSKAAIAPVRRFERQDLAGLPAPVQRYFQHVLPPGRQHIAWVSYKSSGEFRLPFSDKFFSVSAYEYLSAATPGLIFDAQFDHCPIFGAWVHVRDKYAAQKANMYGNLFSGVNIINESNAAELDQDMFLRFIGHLALIPTALLPNDYLKWEGIDDNTAKLVVADGANTGSAIVGFNILGEIVRWETEGRYDRLEGKYRKVKHVGYRSNYRAVSGVKIPFDFKVEKILPDGTREVFWHGSIAGVRFADFEG